MRTLPALLLAALPLTAAAQPICLDPADRAPFVDGEVIGCDGGLPRLTVVREAAVYDPDLTEWRQAILLRFAQPEAEELVVSGVIDVRGAEIIGDPIHRAADLRRGDFDWAIAPLSHYEDAGDCAALIEPPPQHPLRGLEFGDLVRFDPERGRLRFEFAAAADLDDVRVVLATPDPAPAGRLEIELFGVLTSPGVEVQVGAIDLDLAPDDGPYDAIDRVVPVRLRESDLDVPVDCVSGVAGGALPLELIVPVDSPPGRPANRDRRRDFNGDLGPVEALGAPSLLRWRPTDLVSPAGDVLAVEALAGLDFGLCAPGDAVLPLTVFVEPAGAAPEGVYGGELTIWDDADDDRRFDRDEAGDVVRLAVVVGPLPAEDPCALLPPEPDAGVEADAGLDLDAGLEPDAALDLDAASDGALDAEADAGLDAEADAGLDAEADAGLDAEADAGLEGGVVPPADAGLDGGADGAPTDGALDEGIDGAPVDGALDGGADGAADASLDGAADALLDGMVDGPADAMTDGTADGMLDGTTDGMLDGTTDGMLDGTTDGTTDGIPDGMPDGTADGMLDGTTDGMLDGTVDVARDGSPDAATPDATAPDATAPDAAPDTTPAPADPGDPQGGALSCRAAPGAPTGPPSPCLALIAALALLRRRALPAALALLAFTAPARAQVDVRRFDPTPAMSPYLNLDGSETLGGGAFAARLVSVLEQRPLVFAREGERTVDIIGIRLGLDAAAAVGLTDWLDLGASLPLVLLQDGRAIETDEALPRFALADPALSAKVRLVSKRHGAGLALRVAGTAPLGDAEALAGDEGPTGTAMLAAEIPIGPRFDVVLDLGYRIRAAARLGDVPIDDELLIGLGASWRVTPDFALAAELALATAAADPFAVEQQTPGGLDVVGRVAVVDDLAVVAGVGAGLLPGYGAPLYRAFLGLQFAPRNHDFDGDGLADGRDRCLEVPGVSAEAGCPAPPPVVAEAPAEPAAPSRDQDGDDLVDALDRCPYLAEDRDGFRDDDGCPDGDNDLDLLADGFDADPMGPEDWDAFEDGDGIPDLDNDRDGIADFRDACPMEKGGADGCPGSAPAVAQRVAVDSDGPVMLGGTLHPAEPVRFEGDTATPAPEATAALDGLAGYLLAHPELDRVEVGVHVDDLGSRGRTRRLSQARAEAVVAALVARGVPAARVFPRGYGADVPVQSDETEGGRLANRRVELRALRPFELDRPGRAAPRTRDDGGLPAPQPRWLPADAVVLRPSAPLPFEPARAPLRPAARPLIAELAAQIAANPGWGRIEVGVHTDGRGNRDWKRRLTVRRAEAVVEALVAAGVERDRLVPRGYGATRRLRGDETRAGREANRRVELRVLETSVSLGPGGR